MRRRGFCLATVLIALAWTVTGFAAIPARPEAGANASSGVYYEIFVRSWYDTNGDGIGDLNGVTAKLDYLQRLGVSGIWLMPINPSPSYHGYDITDYRAINPQYGSMADFERLVREAHKRGIKIIMDLVINHTSNESPWFKAARNPHSRYHDWYTWATPETDLKAISATSGFAWHALADGQTGSRRSDSRQEYLGVFTDEMPDLNYDDPAVRKEMIEIGRFWLKKGVDGFRLDAAQHIYLDFETDWGSASVLRKNLDWWSEFHGGIDAANPHAWLVGEVWQQNPADLAPWMGALDAVFNFPLAARLIESAKQERDRDIGATLARIDAAYRAAAHGRFDDAPLLSNHDTERVMSQLDDNADHMRVAAAMLLTLPGHPFVYYGEELGMRGQKPDPHLREPMRWYRAGKGPGEPTWEGWTAGDGPDVSVQAEQKDPGSLLNWYRMLIGWRCDIPALRDGTARDWRDANIQVAAWELGDPHGDVLVLHNLSGKPQTIKLPARRFHALLKRSRADTTIAGDHLHLPPYGSAVLQ
ncbi:MAG TPA: alpha-amylase family glycosyl hydrolase [Rhodanobacteraceae bacterium]|nr:alpha-amylase family glycosyl hydrolase [Rhodanobacteraceae bacterium]